MGRSTLFYGLSSELLRLSSRVPGRNKGQGYRGELNMDAD